jgi:hypothetical protein
MKMGKNWYHKIINILLLAIFLFYFGSVTLFYHCHTVDGVTIVHSHFYLDGDTASSDTSTNTQHKHSSAELHLISHLSIILSLLAGFTFLFRCFVSKTFKQVVLRDISIVYHTHLLNLSLRAPPITLL